MGVEGATAKAEAGSDATAIGVRTADMDAIIAYLRANPGEQNTAAATQSNTFSSGSTIQDLGHTRCNVMCHTGKDPGPVGPDVSQDLVTRVGGGLQAIGGVAETKFGIALSSTGIGATIGVPIAAHGIDNTQAGIRKVWSGEPVKTGTEQLVTAVAEKAGVSPENAERIGSGVDTALDLSVGGAMLYKSVSKGMTAYATAEAAREARGETKIVLDMFGGKSSQIDGAFNIDIAAEKGLRLDARNLSTLPDGIADEVIASNPYIPATAGGKGTMDYLPEVARVLKPGGKLYINSTVANKFGKLPDSATLEKLELRVVVNNGALNQKFSGISFHLTDGRVIPPTAVRTSIIEKIKP